jgi:hypothetical protein
MSTLKKPNGKGLLKQGVPHRARDSPKNMKYGQKKNKKKGKSKKGRTPWTPWTSAVKAVKNGKGKCPGVQPTWPLTWTHQIGHFQEFSDPGNFYSWNFPCLDIS